MTKYLGRKNVQLLQYLFSKFSLATFRDDPSVFSRVVSTPNSRDKAFWKWSDRYILRSLKSKPIDEFWENLSFRHMQDAYIYIYIYMIYALFSKHKKHLSSTWTQQKQSKSMFLQDDLRSKMSPGKTNGEKKLAKDHLSLDQHSCRQVDPAIHPSVSWEVMKCSLKLTANAP